MLRHTLTLSALAACAGLATGALAQSATPALTPPALRITDEAIQADHQAYEAMQGRLKALNDAGRPVRDYGLAKAQCWLDVSFHEYTRNDRSAFPELALGQADLLARAMQAGQAPGWDTPLVNNAARLRADLWDRAAALRGHSGWRCAQHKVACAEVELVHAGNEHQQLQWRHAKPYVQIAEDLLGEADTLAQRCDPPAPPPVVAPPPPPPAPPVVQVQRVVELAVSVVFSFDRHGAADIRPLSLVQLKELVARLQQDRLAVTRLQLAGHADRLNGTGQADYNQQLSEKRAATVRAMLAELGLRVADSQVQLKALGDAQQVQACTGPSSSRAELEECLLPNRRVEVLVTAEPLKP